MILKISMEAWKEYLDLFYLKEFLEFLAGKN
jgi:hypothetical protein